MGAKPKRKTQERVKLGTILDKDMVTVLKKRAAEEDRTISEVIQDAMAQYGHIRVQDVAVRMLALERLFAHQFHLSDTDWDKLMADDYYNQ